MPTLFPQENYSDGPLAFWEGACFLQKEGL